jgi:hypothetical protein
MSATSLPSAPRRSSLTEARPDRSLALFAAGALIGLGIAGYGLFTARGTATNTVPPEDVALINQRPILRVDYLAQLEGLYNVSPKSATREQQQKVLDDMIREELFVQRGLELDMPSSDPDTRAALVASVEQQVAANVTSEVPTETALMAFYQQHRQDYATEGTITLHDLVLSMGGGSTSQLTARAQAAAAALRAGQPLLSVATRYGLKESGRLNGEEFYFAARIHLGPKLFGAAAQLKDGAVSDPILESDGVHILQMVRNQPPVARDFQAAREKVVEDYRNFNTQRIQEGEYRFLRKRAEILIAPDYL